MHLCTPIPSEMLLLNWKLVTRWKVSLLFSPEDTVSVISNKNVKCVIAGSNPVNLKQVSNAPRVQSFRRSFGRHVYASPVWIMTW